MSVDPYKVPDSDLETHEDLPSRPILGVAVGLVVDLGGTFFCVFISAFVYSVILAADGTSQTEIVKIVANSGPTSPVGIVNILIGLSMSFLGGMYCARVARSKDYKYPGILALIIFLFGIVFARGEINTLPLVILSLAIVLFILLGARMHLRK